MASNAENVSIWWRHHVEKVQAPRVVVTTQFNRHVSRFYEYQISYVQHVFYEIINFNMADEIPRQPFAIQWATASDEGGFKPDVKQRHCEMEGFLQLSNQVWDQAYLLHNN